MRPSFYRASALALCLFALSGFAAPASAAGYPDHAVKIIVPFPAGGTADAVPRLIGDWLSKKWGQPVVIENRTGAAGNIGAEVAYHATPDGYTLLSSPPPPLVMNQSLYPSLPFDPAKFEPVVVMAQVPSGLFVNPAKIKADTVPELIAYLQAEPGQGDRRDARQRHHLASHHRTVQDVGEREAARYSVSRFGAGAAGPARRRHRPDVRQSRRLAADGQCRQAEIAGSRHVATAAVAAEGADRRRDAARFRVGGVVRHRRAAGHAEGRRREDQRRRERGASSSPRSRPSSRRCPPRCSAARCRKRRNTCTRKLRAGPR